mmetsp:Transcript_16872/g.18821  ORF Transcript_16872/g.18821 Transcript_16872/m.18821 type:complete len:169 (+) Transcript_16872:9-515(+)
MEKIVYVPVNQMQQKESSVVESAKSVRTAATIIAIASLAIVYWIWTSSEHTPDLIFYALLGLNGILIIYSLAEKWIGHGCIKSLVHVFAWTGFSIAALSGAFIIYSLLVGGFAKPDQLLLLFWSGIIAPIGFLGYSIIFVEQAHSYTPKSVNFRAMPSELQYSFQNKV